MSLKPLQGFSGDSVGKESACNTGDSGSILGSGRSTGEGNGYSLQYSCLKNPMVGGAWQATVDWVTRVGHDLASQPPPNHHIWIKVDISQVVALNC